jgi:hypothetical protein
MHTCNYNCDCEGEVTELPFVPDPQHSTVHGSCRCPERTNYSWWAVALCAGGAFYCVLLARWFD